MFINRYKFGLNFATIGLMRLSRNSNSFVILFLWQHYIQYRQQYYFRI